MIVLKIIGILLAVISAVLVFALLQSLKVVFTFDTVGKLELKAKIMFFTLYDVNKKNQKNETETPKKKKDKKQSRLSEYFKRLFGIDTIADAANVKENSETQGISDSVNKIVTVLSMMFGQIIWLFKKVRVHRFHVLAVCGGSDAADVAMEYGLVCASIYPLVGYIETNFDTKQNATDVQIGCDFENEAYFETDFIIKLRLIHIIRAVWKNAKIMAEEQARLEANI